MAALVGCRLCRGPKPRTEAERHLREPEACGLGRAHSLVEGGAPVVGCSQSLGHRRSLQRQFARRRCLGACVHGSAIGVDAGRRRSLAGRYLNGVVVGYLAVGCAIGAVRGIYTHQPSGRSLGDFGARRPAGPRCAARHPAAPVRRHASLGGSHRGRPVDTRLALCFLGGLGSLGSPGKCAERRGRERGLGRRRRGLPSALAARAPHPRSRALVDRTWGYFFDPVSGYRSRRRRVRRSRVDRPTDDGNAGRAGLGSAFPDNSCPDS